MALRDYDFCGTKGGKAFGPYSQQGGGFVGFYLKSLYLAIYKERPEFQFEWVYTPAERLLLPRELM